jgi:hypothetical protein
VTGARYVCCNDRRRDALRGHAVPPEISGIDYIEVTAGNPVSLPTTIDIVLVNPLTLPAAALTGANISITGGVRYPAPMVDQVVETLPAAGPVSTYRVTVPGGQLTDYSTYRLAIVDGSGSDQPPSFIDPRLSAVDFSFKIDCGSDFDCASDCRELPTSSSPEPEFDYRTREWAGFRQLMLDRMSVLVPGFHEDNPVDLTTTVIEALAYRADQQSYRLDWVGTEAFLDSARSRTSVARHARLVDYYPGEGASARTFVALTFEPDGTYPDGFILPAGTPLLPHSGSLPTVVAASDYASVLEAAAPVVFETRAAVNLWAWQASIAFHTWSDEQCTLAKGSTQATVVDGSGGGPGTLASGDFLLLTQTHAPDTGAAADADPARRHVVRLTRVTPVTDVLAPTPLLDLEWGADDALPFDLVISAQVASTTGPPRQVVCAAAQGNITLADHGASMPPPAHLGLTAAASAATAPRLDPPAPEAGISWRPLLRGGVGPLARAATRDPDAVPALSASELLTFDPATCLPAVVLRDDFAEWTVRRDLLNSGPFSRDFVVEASPTGAPALRFGDNTHGLAPATGAALGVSGRFGTGTVANLGPSALGHVVLPDAQANAPIRSATNPIAAAGGAAPEALDAIRVAAPQAFRVPQRAVTADDYAFAARLFAGVANSKAVARWTGSWQTVVIAVDRRGGAPVDDEFRAGLLAHLERFRLAGFDVAVRPAQPAPLDISLAVCAEPDQLRSIVGQRVHEALSPFGDVDGTPGFFHPDNFTFGTVLYLSALIAAVMAVPGVQSVAPLVFQRFGRLPQDELTLGAIRPVGTEVLELMDDPSFPERGRLQVTMGGGR